MVSAANLCILCKGGRALCGHSPCPKLASIYAGNKLQEKYGTDFFGPSVSVFVGRYGYPKVNVGPMVTFEPGHANDTPSSWMSLDYAQIVEMRSLLLRSKQPESIFARNRFVEENQELAMAQRPTDVELEFTKKPQYRMSFSSMVQPMGPTASIEKFRITENPYIPKKVDYIVNDELKAAEQSYKLYNAEVSNYKIITILSSGAMGMEQSKKIVPTRWSITAIDDTIGKKLIEEVKEHKSVNKFEVYESEYLSNHFLILFMPGNWEYEGFEAWAPGTVWSQGMKEPYIIPEYEPYTGRTKYAEGQGGGYYATRLGCLEALNTMRRQARVVVFREVYEGYTVPLGVWVVRETVRNAFKKPKTEFDTKKEALQHIDSKLRLPVQKYLDKGTLLKQARLTEF